MQSTSNHDRNDIRSNHHTLLLDLQKAPVQASQHHRIGKTQQPHRISIAVPELTAIWGFEDDTHRLICRWSHW